MKPLRVEIQPWLKHYSRAAIAFFSFCCVSSALSGAWWASLGFLPLMALSACLLLFVGPIEADFGGVWQTTPAGRYEIKWSEVTKIETAGSTDIVLHTPGKRLAIPGPSLWRAHGREEMNRFLESQIAAWSIPCQRTARAAFQTSKNTKAAPEIRRPPLAP